MRAWELLLVEADASEFDSDLEDLIIAAKANGITDISVDNLVDQLNAMGHSVTPDSLVSDLESKENQFIKNVTLDKITLKSHTVDDEEATNDYEDQEADAGRIATKTAMKGVKKNRDNIKRAAQDQL